MYKQIKIIIIHSSFRFIRRNIEKFSKMLGITKLTATCSKKITGTAEISFNYRPITAVLRTEESFTIPVGNGIGSISGYLEYNRNSLTCRVKKVKNLHGEVTMKISNDTKVCQTLTGEYAEINRRDQYLFCRFDQPAIFLDGKIAFTFEPAEVKQFEANASSYFSILKYIPGPTTQPYDIKLVVHNQEFDFKMECLERISSVFKDMFENSTMYRNRLEITGESVETMQSFKNILEGIHLRTEQITLELYKFADRFDIQPLLKACGEYFSQNVSRENKFELAIMANRVNDKVLLKSVATLLLANMTDGATRNFLQNNRDLCATLTLSLY